MDIKITYPTPKKQRIRREAFLFVAQWPMIATAILCPIINWIVGGKAWSVIVLMGLYTVWTLGLSIDLVEYNRISQCIKYTVYACITLVLIDVLIVPLYASLVVPLVGCGGLIVASILFLTDVSRQKQNMLPMLNLIFLSLIASAFGIAFYHHYDRLVFAIMGAMALIWLIVCICVLRGDFLRELRRRFHIT